MHIRSVEPLYKNKQIKCKRNSTMVGRTIAKSQSKQIVLTMVIRQLAAFAIFEQKIKYN